MSGDFKGVKRKVPYGAPRISRSAARNVPGGKPPPASFTQPLLESALPTYEADIRHRAALQERAKEEKWVRLASQQDPNTFRGARIRERVSLKQMAAALHVTPRIVSDVERGNAVLDYHHQALWFDKLHECKRDLFLRTIFERALKVDALGYAEWEPYASQLARRKMWAWRLIQHGHDFPSSVLRERILEMRILRASVTTLFPTYDRPDRRTVVGVAIRDTKEGRNFVAISPHTFAPLSREEWQDARKFVRNQLATDWGERGLSAEMDLDDNPVSPQKFRIFAGPRRYLSCIGYPEVKDVLRHYYRDYVVRQIAPPDLPR